MGLVSDIMATYQRPGTVVARLLTAGQREDRALVILMAGCGAVFIAQWPRLAREAHMTGQELNPLLGGALLGWLAFAPLFFYTLALVLYLITRPVLKSLTSYGARLALFWAWLAASPLLLVYGLVAGFVGQGAYLQIVGAIWIVAFLWFCGSGFRAANARGQE